MNGQIQEKVQNIFERQKGFARTKDFLNNGISNYYIRKLETQGEIIRIKQGLYRYSKYEGNHYDEFVEVSKIIPKGVMCLLSALAYYELTTYNPWEYQIAIYRGTKKPSLPDYPPIKVVYFSETQYQYGIDEIEIDGNKVKIYDREKTICDIIRYREKIGIDVMKEGLRNYLQRPEKNITKLVGCAEKLRIKTVLLKYLEVLL
ncbi:type IV toxin-antitoxin system AbiEi family antitoxin domain-containing protein [Brevibacillus nitrificans]|uniref:type IV toxin-antitoxin system AbiEi family antitoxin domain-containing protein n=1 Tax=Brevibacillus nitrificans TaxID=651560 RepID=UPI002859F23F|nr:type IV toxin-antitoxin system AbiEi family antitoxin domain-containing protein [Brevibacillus nitrificans]MDR7314881.1 putative transcriptional regulator of viral defense system [Brevibacillus nitrificans]